MSKNKKHYYDNNRQNPEKVDENVAVNPEAREAEAAELEAEDEASVEEVIPEESEEVDSLEKKLQETEEKLEKEKKEYLFLMAEFENFRKRTMKEKADLIKNGGEKVLKGILPILDDFERGIKASADATDAKAVLEGMELIYNKLRNYLEQNGVKEMDPADDVFDTEKHEAISVVPVPDDDKKGKILDTVQKGYTLNGKVLRHAKVVVGQ